MMRNFADDCRSRLGLWSAPLLLCMALLAHSTGNTYALTTTSSSNFPWLNEDNSTAQRTTSSPIVTSPNEENLPVRLVGSSSISSGRVEIYRNGVWGTVCDDLWDDADATVVCQQLGFDGDSVAYQSAYFGMGDGPILMDNVQCSGNETHLSQCLFPGFGVHDCSHGEDAGVACNVTSSSSTTQRTTSSPIVTSPNEENPPVRLVGSSSNSSGRVEIYHNGVWGTVCDDFWDNAAAAVVCRQLGFYGDSVAYQAAYFGKGDDPILMDDVWCSGNETHLSECLFRGFGVHNCGHHEDAGVACNVTSSSSTTQRTTSSPIVTSPIEENPAVRLMGSSSYSSGRVEIYRNGVWGTVCDDFWDNADAAVVCRQLGFYGDSVAYQAAYFGKGDGPILMDDVWCSGNETYLSECLFRGFGVHNCGHHEDAGVACNVTSSSSTSQRTTGSPIVTSPNEENLPVRLVGSSSSSSGRVEIYRNGVWGTVCDDGWDNADAAVVCRQLGFYGDSVAYQAAYFGMGDGPILMDDVWCSGYETHLSECLFPGFGVHNCGHHEDAGVACIATSGSTTTQRTTSSSIVPSTNEGSSTIQSTTSPPNVTSPNEENLPVRLVGSSSSSSGRVEIYRNGVWGTVCDDLWDDVDAAVVCRQLGFDGDSAAYQAAYFGMGDGPILMDNVQCSGIETHLSECLFPGFGVHDCSHGEDAGVACNVASSNSTVQRTTSPPIVTSWIEGSTTTQPTTGSPIVTSPNEENLAVRLVGSIFNSSGRVEVYHNGVWGTVCDDLWDDTDAAVVCRQLGFAGDSVAYQAAYFGMGDGPILMDNVQCSGIETHLSECLFPGFGVHDCSHGEDAGVACFVTSKICPEGQDTYIADENNPGRYYQCDNGVARLRDCAPGTVWDQASITCVHDGSQQAPTWFPFHEAQEESFQHGDECDPSTTYYPHADCTKFIVCLYGTAYEIPCASGLRYNPAINNCDFADNVPCP